MIKIPSKPSSDSGIESVSSSVLDIRPARPNHYSDPKLSETNGRWVVRLKKCDEQAKKYLLRKMKQPEYIDTSIFLLNVSKNPEYNIFTQMLDQSWNRAQEAFECPNQRASHTMLLFRNCVATFFGHEKKKSEVIVAGQVGLFSKLVFFKNGEHAKKKRKAQRNYAQPFVSGTTTTPTCAASRMRTFLLGTAIPIPVVGIVANMVMTDGGMLGHAWAFLLEKKQDEKKYRLYSFDSNIGASMKTSASCDEMEEELGKNCKYLPHPLTMEDFARMPAHTNCLYLAFWWLCHFLEQSRKNELAQEEVDQVTE